MSAASRRQVAGSHYRDFAIQPSEFIQRNGLDWCAGNVIKYVCRHRQKNGREDLEKAAHYIQLLIEWEYPDASAAVPAPPAPVHPVRPVSNGGDPECGLYRDLPGRCPSCEEDD